MEHPEGFRAQLAAAKWFEWWAGQLEAGVGTSTHGPNTEFGRGFVVALEHVVCTVRSGNLMPGGDYYDQTFTNNPEFYRIRKFRNPGLTE